MTTATQEDYYYVLSHAPRFLHTQFSPTVLSVFLFYVDRTLRFNKTSENISSSAYKHGVSSKEGAPIVGPLCLGKNTIVRAKEELERLGLIKIVSGTGNKYSKITLVLHRIKKLIKKEMIRMAESMLKKPKKERPQGVPKMGRGGTQNGYPKGIESKVKESKDLKQTETVVSDGSSPAKRKQKQLRDRRKDKVNRIDVISRKNLLLIWTEASMSYKEDHPDSVILPADMRMVGKHINCMRKIFKGRDTAWKHYVYDSVANWDTLVPHFKWLGNKGGIPSVPNLQFITAFYKQILSAQQEQLKVDANNNAQRARRDADDKRSTKELDKAEEENKRLRQELNQAKRSNNNMAREMVKNSKRAKTRRKERLIPMTDQELSAVGDLPAWEELEENNIH